MLDFLSGAAEPEGQKDETFVENLGLQSEAQSLGA